MRLATRGGLIATCLAVAAIAAPAAHAGGLFSTGPDPGAAQQEAQGFLRIYSHPASTLSVVATPNRATNPGSGFDWGAAGVGAGAAFGLAMILVGLVLVVSQRRTRHAGRSAAIVS